MRFVAAPGSQAVIDMDARSLVSTDMGGNSVAIIQNVTMLGLCAVPTTRMPGLYFTGVTNGGERCTRHASADDHLCMHVCKSAKTYLQTCLCVFKPHIGGFI